MSRQPGVATTATTTARTARTATGTVTGALWLLAGQVVVGALTAVLAIVMRDDLVRTWQAGHPDTTGDLKPPQFVPVAIVLFVVFAVLLYVLGTFLRYAHEWARISLTVLTVFMTVATLAGLRADPPALFLVLALVSAGLDLALLGCLWHPDTSGYFRRALPMTRPGPTARS